MKDTKKTFLTILLVALGMGFALSSAQAAAPANLIVNGDFETGTFAGWSVVTGAFGATMRSITEHSFHFLGVLCRQSMETLMPWGPNLGHRSLACSKL